MTNSYEPHRALEIYAEAATEAGLPARSISFTGNWSPGSRRPTNAVRNVANPWLIARRVRGAVRNGEWAFLREFLTLPLFAASPSLFTSRRRLILICNHNAQRAASRPRERFALNLMARLGFRFLMPETTEGLSQRDLGPFVRRAVVLPLPLTEAQTMAQIDPKGELVVGVIGRPRAEKRMKETVAELHAAGIRGGNRLRLLVGYPGGQQGDFGEGVEVVDTARPEAYRAALARCRIVVFRYSREDYEFRPSAALADAVAAHAAVIGPDFPVMRAQLTNPVEVGVCVAPGESLDLALQRGEEIALAGAGRFPLWLAMRSRPAIGRFVVSKLAGLD